MRRVHISGGCHAALLKMQESDILFEDLPEDVSPLVHAAYAETDAYLIFFRQSDWKAHKRRCMQSA